jgi:hypothetical protein
VDPKLLVYLKSYRNTVPVPRHWSQKRKFLQVRQIYLTHLLLTINMGTEIRLHAKCDDCIFILLSESGGVGT